MVRLTIDQLAQRSGVTTRNIRAYQERGLLEPPTRVGRVGYYDDGHVARLSVIASLLDRGYSLASIRELLDAWASGGDFAGLLGFERAVARPWTEESPEHASGDALQERFGGDDDALARAVDLGLIAPEGDRYRVPSPQALDAGAELVAAGVPLADVLDEAAALQADADRIAARFVDLFVRHVWQPFVDAGMPADELPRITALVERLRPVPGMAVVPALAMAMERQVNAAVGAALDGASSVGEAAAS